MSDILKIIIPTVLTFFVGFAITPFFTRYFYRYKMWKKSSRALSDTSETFGNIHNGEHETSTPRIGGVIIWMAVLISISLIYLAATLIPHPGLDKLNFFSRSQTLVPLGAFFFAAGVGLFDDLLQIYGHGHYAKDPLIYRKVKIAAVAIIALFIGYWFYYKLEWSTIHVPFKGLFDLGIFFIPFFIMVMLATFSTAVIDGLDGLAGGVLATIFGAYTVIGFFHDQLDIAALCGALAGAILAFLWFNIPPARFYMGETGMLALTMILGVIAFLTDTVLVLPLIALPLVLTTASDIIQITAYKYFGKRRVFRVAPLHHHFQALGWPREKVVMRYWVVSVIAAISGVILVLVSTPTTVSAHEGHALSGICEGVEKAGDAVNVVKETIVAAIDKVDEGAEKLGDKVEDYKVTEPEKTALLDQSSSSDYVAAARNAGVDAATYILDKWQWALAAGAGLAVLLAFL